MKLFDATLDLAAYAKGTEDYVITEADPTHNKIICGDLAGRVAEFGGGTCWFRTGESAGKIARIKTSAAQTITLLDNMDYAAGDEITIGSWLEFDTQKLINAVNSVLRMYKILKVNTALAYDPDTRYYELPEEVTEDIRKIVIPLNHHGFQAVCHFWRVENGQLEILDRYRRYLKNDPIRIYYVDYHGAVEMDGEISNQVDPLYLRYMSWLYLCRNLIQNTHKDNLVASDMYNEAKIYERDYAHLPNKSLGIRTFTFPQW